MEEGYGIAWTAAPALGVGYGSVRSASMHHPTTEFTRRIALYDHPAFGAHAPPAGRPHPERPERLDAARKGLSRLGAGTFVRPEVPVADVARLERVHDPDHLRRLFERFEAEASGFLDADTYFGPGTAEAVLRASGAASAAVRAVVSGPARRAIVLARPPGHHAEPDRAMGFCIVNHVAVAAAEALALGLERVAVVDFDVHHGNGTQRIFEADPRVLFVSLHEWPLYPGTGDVSEVGRGAGRGRTVNVPLPAGSDGAVYRAAFLQIVLPILEGFRPQLVLVSAGFDAHGRDPLAHMALGARDFGAMAAALCAVADASAGGRIVVLWEGGYDLMALADGWEWVAQALAASHPTPPTAERHGAKLPGPARLALERARAAALDSRALAP